MTLCCFTIQSVSDIQQVDRTSGILGASFIVMPL